MTRDEFLAEAHRRGYPRESLFLVPGPDENRNPEGGGVVIEGPSPRTGGRWRTYKDDRGIKGEAFFDSADAAYQAVLDRHLPAPSGSAGPADREAFLDELERRGGRRSWIAFRDSETDPPAREGQFAIETYGGSVRTYRMAGGRQDEQFVDDEAAAWHTVLDALPGARR